MIGDLSGIENEAEFFPAGTLSEALQDELREITSRWSRLEGRANPIERLTQCAQPYLLALQQIRNSADAERRAELRSDATHALVTALGYDYGRISLHTALEGDPIVPALSRVADLEGRDIAWLLEASLKGVLDEATDPLSTCFDIAQFPEGDREYAETSLAIEEILADGIFRLRNSPRHVLIFGVSQIVLVDRNKWPARSVLRFDLQQIFSRHDAFTLTVMCCLISREARVPQHGVPIADRIEEEAQRNANAVTTSLKRTVRDAIEILGQEVLDVTGGKYLAGPRKGVWIEGPELSLECLRYMYRLLFLFYAEANPRLNILDLKDPVYASGYSLEALRELESVRLRTPVEKCGTYLWQSLQRTLTMLYQGNNTSMRLPAIRVSLLDPESTPILNEVSLRNEAIQKVVRLLSLKRARSGTTRISYAKLGIGQLGAVYETLISFTGVVAKQDMIELRPQTGRKGPVSDIEKSAIDEDETDEQNDEGAEQADDTIEDGSENEAVTRNDRIDLLAPSYFVPRSRANEFRPAEIVFDGPEARVYRKGTFIYRLAGRDREKSASYYTPEPLARLLVKHALQERCSGLSADALLELKILEPAMGSAAFLVETANQLADLYLERKQTEVGRTIPQDQIVIEKQRVRAFIADRNCFGVDLNPVAVELGAISLWLNSLHASEFSPWFGDQLHAGNSLIGARRASYPPNLLTATTASDLWLNCNPQEVGWKGRLRDGDIWQFLLPAKDMAKFDGDASITEFAGEAQQTIKDWRKGGFFKRLEPHEIKLLQKLSRIVDDLFGIVAEDLANSRAASNDAITLWPDKKMPGVAGLDFHEKARRLKRLVGSDHATNTLPYKRLKTAMDAWCALWLWPLDKVDLLPNRGEFLHGMAMILEGGFMPDGSIAAPSMEEFSDPTADFHELLEQRTPQNRPLTSVAKKKRDNLFRETDVDTLVEEVDWLKVAVGVASRERFTHFDLICADVLKARGGFDLVVGNPPWSRPSWNETDVIGDIDPGFITRKLSATETRLARAKALPGEKERKAFLTAYVAAKGGMTATGSSVMNPFAGGGQNNLYRCFIDLSFRLVAPQGCAALIHQDGHLNDPKSSSFRREWYSRIAKHFHCRNEIKSKMFTEVHNETEFSLNVYRGAPGLVCFEKYTGAFLASQIEDSYSHDGTGTLPSIKTAEGKWDTRGHRDRIVRIDHDALTAIHSLIEDNSVPVVETRFLQPYSAKMLDVFRAMAATPALADAVVPIPGSKSAPDGDRGFEVPGWQMSTIWHESGAQKDLGVIRRETRFQDDPTALVISGPMFHVGNPIYKSPRHGCRSNKDYDVVDLSIAPDNYVPRTNYSPAVEIPEYRRQLPRCRWDSTKSHVDFYRMAFRKMVALNGERSLIGCIIAKGIAHIDGVQSVAFNDPNSLLIAASNSQSLPLDYLIKASARQNLHDSEIASLPFVDPGDTAKHRTLRLACVTSAYSQLWDDLSQTLAPLPWHTLDPRLTLDGPYGGPDKWNRSAALRTDFARRMALVEIDVLVAQALGLTLDQLIEIYRIYFSVLRQNETGTWYDQSGRIVWSCSKGLPGVGYLEDGKSPSRKRWEQILASEQPRLSCETVIDFMPGGPRTVTRVFEGPFDRCDRVEDYKRAWTYFAEHQVKEAAA